MYQAHPILKNMARKVFGPKKYLDGTIIHDLDAVGNYDASEIVQKQAMAGTRKIWTVLPDKDYRTDYTILLWLILLRLISLWGIGR